MLGERISVRKSPLIVHFREGQKMTKEEMRELLRENGFVRVDGLATYRPGDNEESVIVADESHLGRWDYNNGIYAVVTTGGEVWIRAAEGAKPSSGFFETVTPNRSGCFVPCSNGEWPAAYQLLARVADPDYVTKALNVA